MLDYFLHLGTIFLLLGTLTLCLDIIVGFVGYLNLGHVAYWAIGSYTYSLLVLGGVPFIPAMVAAGFVTAGAGFLLGLPTLRLKTHYIAIASLGFMYITNAFIMNMTGVTRGPLGLPGIPRPNIFGYVFRSELDFFLLTLVISVIVTFLIHRILYSPFGKILETIREDEIASRSLGKSTFAYKLQANIISAFFVGIMSALSSSFFQFISPLGFGMQQLIFFLAALMIGGAGSFWGGFLGVIIVQGIEEITRFLPLTPNTVGPMRTIIYAVILIGVMLYRPNGILGKKLKAFER